MAFRKVTGCYSCGYLNEEQRVLKCLSQESERGLQRGSRHATRVATFEQEQRVIVVYHKGNSVCSVCPNQSVDHQLSMKLLSGIVVSISSV